MRDCAIDLPICFLSKNSVICKNKLEAVPKQILKAKYLFEFLIIKNRKKRLFKHYEGLRANTRDRYKMHFKLTKSNVYWARKMLAHSKV